MDQNRLFLGKLLAEIYRTQKALKICKVEDATIFGLSNGFEDVIDEQVEGAGVSSQQLQTVTEVLGKYWPEQMETVTGYDIEGELKGKGIQRGTARKIFNYFLLSGEFIPLLEKIGKGDRSPAEFHHLGNFAEGTF